MLYLCIPSHDEAPTVGLLLWRIRKVLRDFPREYEVLVCNDGSTDSTVDTLTPYADVLPLTVISGERRGYAGALDTLLRAASQRTRYPRRDAIITMQADFTDQPEHLPELIRRFEGGADVVVAEREPQDAPPTPVRRLQRLARWAVRPSARVPGVADPFGTFRLYRISVMRDLLRDSSAAVDTGTPDANSAATVWAANLDLLRRAAVHARRIETITASPRYDLRPRETRVKPWSDALSLFRYGRSARRLPVEVV